MDIILIMEVLKQYQVVAVHYPLFCYNFHGYPVKYDDLIKDDTIFNQYIETHKHEWDLNRFMYYPPPTIENVIYKPLKKTIENVWYAFDPNLTPISRIPPNTFHATIHRPKTAQGWAFMLGKTKNFYTFDFNLELIYKAMLCGCNVFCVWGETCFPISPEFFLFAQKQNQGKKPC
jgi:hypothetical protein